MSEAITVQAPGKLYIAGEYAVVESGQPAVLIAIDRFMTVKLAPAENYGLVRSHGAAFDTVYWRHENGTPVFDDFGQDYAANAIRIIEKLREERGLPARHYTIDITSGLVEKDGRKYGLGSSAAVTVAIVDALGKFYGLELSDLERFKLALIAVLERAPRASGGDVAASTYGGWLFYTSPDRAGIVEKATRGTVEETLACAAWDSCRIEKLPAPAQETLQVGWTRSPASTEHLVSGVQARSKGSYFPGFLEKSAARVAGIVAALRSASPIGPFVSQARELLRKLGDTSGICIETPLLTALCDIAEKHGAYAKSSGAGGGDCGIALVPAEIGAKIADIHQEWQEAGVFPLPLRVWQKQ
ncbi:phosphomevalonate kinase [Actinobaculum suis]|uniref:phosphomevalonate kinase n=1 Tax=Actinobaculum suis TaxID=1657 RepID=A0A0K9ESB9_9ACTO|nr:phosphomevalonate kinase [Actinobaculum suis]KMY23079.1 phosphomevalonate kinase [Actinobaculum suis]OCA94679.1 phosphomevalonate kinase [Actinobaculum suis]OCA95382.1 phosphomevalonate kinase [Actinobaculum suis]VDG76896.1 phosphomevalonate kinase [Actinobaculum suis]